MWKYFSANNTSRYLDILPALLTRYNHSIIIVALEWLHTMHRRKRTKHRACGNSQARNRARQGSETTTVIENECDDDRIWTAERRRDESGENERSKRQSRKAWIERWTWRQRKKRFATRTGSPDPWGHSTFSLTLLRMRTITCTFTQADSSRLKGRVKIRNLLDFTGKTISTEKLLLSKDNRSTAILPNTWR